MTALCCWRCVLTPDATERRNLQLKRERKRIHEEIEKGRSSIQTFFKKSSRLCSAVVTSFCVHFKKWGRGLLNSQRNRKR